jgi:hypothetical protein
MTTENSKPISISYCIRCDVASRDEKDSYGFIDHLKYLLQEGFVKQMTWDKCLSHKPVEDGTQVTAHLVWEEIVKRR